MVKVCDCIMGSGKSSAAITYINEHPDDHFIYITPYLAEAARIRENCPDAQFVEPSDKIWRYQNKKRLHTAALIKEGRNIATTHQAFKNYDADMLDDIREKGYTLIVDENVDVLEEFEFHPDDLRLAMEAGYVAERDGVYSRTDKEYTGRMYGELFSLMRSRNLVRTVCRSDNTLFYWVLPPELVVSFKDVFILTYLFEGQSIHHFLEICHIPYSFIGIERCADGKFRFGPYPGYVPEYVTHLKDMIRILDRDRLNKVGDDQFALSKTWFSRGGEGVERLKLNVDNCYRNVWGDIPADRRLWGSYNGAFSKIKGKGYTKAFLTFNAKATNEFRGRDCLVYIANVFMNVSDKTFYQSHGIEVDDDLYALSVMVQWIWRSAIRDGKPVNIYIPSRRMRTLLMNWIDSFKTEGVENA